MGKEDKKKKKKNKHSSSRSAAREGNNSERSHSPVGKRVKRQESGRRKDSASSQSSRGSNDNDGGKRSGGANMMGMSKQEMLKQLAKFQQMMGPMAQANMPIPFIPMPQPGLKAGAGAGMIPPMLQMMGGPVGGPQNMAPGVAQNMPQNMPVLSYNPNPAQGYGYGAHHAQQNPQQMMQMQGNYDRGFIPQGGNNSNNSGNNNNINNNNSGSNNNGNNGVQNNNFNHMVGQNREFNRGGGYNNHRQGGNFPQRGGMGMGGMGGMGMDANNNNNSNSNNNSNYNNNNMNKDRMGNPNNMGYAQAMPGRDGKGMQYAPGGGLAQMPPKDISVSVSTERKDYTDPENFLVFKSRARAPLGCEVLIDGNYPPELAGEELLANLSKRLILELETQCRDRRVQREIQQELTELQSAMKKDIKKGAVQGKKNEDDKGSEEDDLDKMEDENALAQIYSTQKAHVDEISKPLSAMHAIQLIEHTKYFMDVFCKADVSSVVTLHNSHFLQDEFAESVQDDLYAKALELWNEGT